MPIGEGETLQECETALTSQYYTSLFVFCSDIALIKHLKLGHYTLRNTYIPHIVKERTIIVEKEDKSTTCILQQAAAHTQYANW